MYEAIKNFNRQFSYEPEIKNAENLKSVFSKFVIAGMGGSNLVADLLRIRDPYADIVVHKNYGLPKISEEELNNRLFIASSYSGNTEETVSSLKEAVSRKLSAAVIATGGELIKIAQSYNLPYVQMPSTGIQPRSALGFNIKAVAKIMNREDWLQELSALTNLLNPSEIETQGKTLAKKLQGFIPIIYSSTENTGIAYNWKIKFNETAKTPAFYNVFPELNHNEMTGFDLVRSLAAVSETIDSNGGDILEDRKKLNGNFYFLFLKDPADHPAIQKRIDILEKLYRDRGLPVEILPLNGTSVFHKIFSALVLADWTVYYAALEYNLEPEQVPMVEEFKKLIKQ